MILNVSESGCCFQEKNKQRHGYLNNENHPDFRFLRYGRNDKLGRNDKKYNHREARGKFWTTHGKEIASLPSQ